MIKTPLLEDLLGMLAGTGELPMSRDGESLLFDAGKGVDVHYSQQRGTGEGSYLETIEVKVRVRTLREGKVYDEYVDKGPRQRRFLVWDDTLYLVGDKGPGGGEPGEYKEPWTDVRAMVEAALDERKGRTAADLLKARYAEFDDTQGIDCDRVYLLRTRQLIYLGDRGFIETMKAAIKSGGTLEEGVIAAYRRYESMGSWEDISGHEELAEKLPPGSAVLIMSERDAQELIIETRFNEAYLLKDMLRIGQTDVHLVGKARRFAARFVEFVNNVAEGEELTTKEFSANNFGMLNRSRGRRDTQEFDDILARAMAAEVSEGRKDSLKARAERETADPRMNITQELPQPSMDRIIYADYKLWETVSRRVCMIFEGSIQEKPGRKDEWKEHFAAAVTAAYEKIMLTDYRMLLKIAGERRPEAGRDERRVGVGNIILDFGDRTVVEPIVAVGEQALTPQNLENAYCRNLDRMRAYMFRGRILQPMLKRILSACKPGETVLVDTCKERVEEMARFCEPGKRGGTLNYCDVEIVFTNEEAVEALDEIRKKKQESSF